MIDIVHSGSFVRVDWKYRCFEFLLDEWRYSYIGFGVGISCLRRWSRDSVCQFWVEVLSWLSVCVRFCSCKGFWFVEILAGGALGLTVWIPCFCTEVVPCFLLDSRIAFLYMALSLLYRVWSSFVEMANVVFLYRALTKFLSLLRESVHQWIFGTNTFGDFLNFFSHASVRIFRNFPYVASKSFGYLFAQSWSYFCLGPMK